MNNALRRICMTAAVAALALTGAARSAAQISEPPLLPGEVYLTTPNGCGHIVSAASLKAWGSAEKFFAGMREMGWHEPPCVNGLLHGWGEYRAQYSKYRQEYAYGRFLARDLETASSQTQDLTYSSRCDEVDCDRYASLVKLGAGYLPYWFTDDSGSSLTVGNDGVYVTVSAERQYCMQSVTRVKKCSKNNDFQVFGVGERHWRTSGTTHEDISSRFTACPDPLAPGCESLWREIAAPLIAQTEAIISDAKAERAAKLVEYAALTNPWIARRGEAYRAFAANAARQQAEQIAASLAAADERSKEAEEADADFRKKLNSGNPGQLFALADELASSGEAGKAREALRSLVSRFPDHGLASTAAMRLSGLGGSTTATGSAPKASARYSSVCVRNLQKVEQELVKANNPSYHASNDLWLIELNELSAKIFQPCVAYDKESATNYQLATAEAARIRRDCVSPPHPTQCLPWGYSHPAENQRWYAFWKSQMQRAFADPNYSADLGTAMGPGGTVVGAGVQTASAAGGWDPDTHERCRSELHRLGKEFDGHRARIPADQTVPLMELILWYNNTAWVAIDKSCPGAEAFKAEQASYQTTYKATLKACNQISTRPCEPRLPN